MKMLIAMFVLLLSLSAESALSQTVLSVPYDTAAIRWTAPVDPPPPGVGVTRWYVIDCGKGELRVELPATSVPVKAIAPQPGSYSCTLWAVNNFGRSAPVTVPAFEAGFVPAAPRNLEVR